MHERSISPHPGVRFYAHKSVVDQGVAQVEYTVQRARCEGADVEADYDPVLITLHAQAHALWISRVAGRA
jgi:hypothetical protein